jgi:hypothetical protein
MKTEESKLKAQEEKLDIPVVMQRFKDFIDEYERNIAKEKAFLSELDPIETQNLNNMNKDNMNTKVNYMYKKLISNIYI